MFGGIPFLPIKRPRSSNIPFPPPSLFVQLCLSKPATLKLVLIVSGLCPPPLEVLSYVVLGRAVLRCAVMEQSRITIISIFCFR